MLSDDSKAYLHVSAFSGLWNVPYITGAYLIHGSLMEELRDIYSAENVEPDMAFCGGLRKRVCVFIYLLDNHQYLSKILSKKEMTSFSDEVRGQRSLNCSGHT